MIKVIVDSTCDLPSEVQKQYDIKMVPLQVIIDGIEYKDKQNISVDEVYAHLQAGKYGKTSQPTPTDIELVVEKELASGHDVIFLAVSSKLSGTYQTIHMVLEDLKVTYPNSRITLIDTLGSSGIPALMAVQAGRLIEHDYPYDEICDALLEMASYAEHIFTIDDLKFMFRSGRVKKSEAFLGNFLNIKPILTVIDGEIHILQKLRGMKKTLISMTKLVEERICNFPKQLIAINHANDLATAKLFQSMIEEKLPQIRVMIDQIGSTLGTHIGVGGIGVFFFNREPKLYLLD